MTITAIDFAIIYLVVAFQVFWKLLPRRRQLGFGFCVIAALLWPGAAVEMLEQYVDNAVADKDDP